MANKSSEPGCAILSLVVLAGLAWGGISLHSVIWGEREGDIKTEDCRARILVKEGSSDTWFKTFTCTYQKTQKGVLMGGVCQSVETSGGACTTVYVYAKEGAKVCTDPKFPNLGADDKCYSYPQ
jgi:hypothetical protein